MLEQYEIILDRLREISEALNQTETVQNLTLFRSLLKEQDSLTPKAERYKAYLSLQKQLNDVQELLNDPELGGEAKDEAAALRQRLAEEEEALKLLLIPEDPDDEKNVILEIRGGAGGEEACLFGALLLRMYTRYAENRGWRVEPVSLSDTELGGVKEAVIMIKGNGAFSRLKFESGVHRIQRVPVTESVGRTQTSTCTVAVLPEAEEVEFTIDPQELRIDTYRASGHGGQYINRTDSAVRITHLPTGIVATCQDEKNQLRNKEQAMRVLRSRLYERYRREKDDAYAQNRRSQVGTGDRSERIRSYNIPQGRVTDHRISLTLYRVKEVLEGDLDEILDALHLDEQTRKLKEMNQSWK